ncbi:hypothetical protein CCMSSC00406_0005945 [Pleurotus cornucopiae]|uniref:Uncharacterized protein n=1 Tax=Pleurotus cornucopiae TaxID=5321 RepID=A0ACB7IJC6_PLECO|nr:hypothetical protein CCMSSC00406_0005945 [Pleurotus cornucopiae]
MESEHDTKSAEGDSNVVTDSESVSVEQKRKASRRPSPPPPSPLKRTIFFVFTGFLFWFLVAKLFGLGQQKEPEIVYAQRYSKEYKFRPAASPIITETLKDGRIRLRGTYPTPTPTSKDIELKDRRKGRKKRRSKSRKLKKPQTTR